MSYVEVKTSTKTGVKAPVHDGNPQIQDYG